VQNVQHQTLSFDGFTLDLMRGCLRRGTEEIKLRPKSFEVLRCLAENGGRLVSKEELMAAVWPDTAVTDDSLVQCLIEVRRALNDSDQRIVKTVPRRGYILQTPVIRHDLAAREVIYTEEVEGVRVAVEDVDLALAPGRTKSIVVPEHVLGAVPVEHKRRVRIYALIAGSLVVALAAGALITYLRRKTPPRNLFPPGPSVAVLPFKNLSGRQDEEYFSDGMTESLISSLSKIQNLKVISRGSVIGFEDKEIDPKEVGRRLGVATVLEGSVRKSSDSVRVSVRLVSVEDGSVLWARDTQDQALGDIFALQDEIARSMAASLRLQLSGAAEQQLVRRHTSDVEAYELYLKGRYFWNKRTEEGLRKSLDHLEKAIARDPRYALAYAGLADSYAVLNLYSAQQQTDAFPKARSAAEKALELDDTLAEAHTALAYIKEQYDWDWPGAEREFKRAIELNPNYATAHQYYSEYLAFLGRTEESLIHIRRAHELDPLSLIINTGLGYPYLCARRCNEALGEFRKALEIDPNFPPAVYYTARCLEQDSKLDQAIAEYRRAVTLSGGSSLMMARLGYAYAAAGLESEARGILRELMQLSKQRYISPFLIATIHNGLGEKEQALVWLEKAYKERDGLLVLLSVDSHLDSLRSDPRFAELMRRVGFTQ
jgi:TolB-like protein/DNA-binding winged helix-turn-helix (wHTH) protein/Flp pilus assembly protein TadD